MAFAQYINTVAGGYDTVGVRIGAVATDDKQAIDGVIVLLYKRCIGTAIGGKAALQGGSGVNVLPLLFSQHHPHIAQVVFEEVVVG